MDLLSVLAKVRRQTTLTPNGLTSNARFAARFSIAPNAAPIAVAPGTCGRAGLPVTKMMTPERCLIMWRATARPVIKRDRTIVARHHELLDRQVHSDFPVAVVFGEWAGSIENDINFARLLRDVVDILGDCGVIKRVDYRRVHLAAVRFDLPGYCIHGSLRAARNKDFSALCCELPSDGLAYGTPSAEDNCVLSLQN